MTCGYGAPNASLCGAKYPFFAIKIALFSLFSCICQKKVVILQSKVETMSGQKNSLSKRQSLSKRLFDSGYLWSYSTMSDNAVLPDEELILNGLSHLEFEDMPLLFDAFPYRQIKQVWQQRMLPYPDYYGTLNLLLATLFFHIKSPKKYTAKYVA